MLVCIICRGGESVVCDRGSLEAECVEARHQLEMLPPVKGDEVDTVTLTWLEHSAEAVRLFCALLPAAEKNGGGPEEQQQQQQARQLLPRPELAALMRAMTEAMGIAHKFHVSWRWLDRAAAHMAPRFYPSELSNVRWLELLAVWPELLLHGDNDSFWHAVLRFSWVYAAAMPMYVGPSLNERWGAIWRAATAYAAHCRCSLRQLPAQLEGVQDRGAFMRIAVACADDDQWRQVAHAGWPRWELLAACCTAPSTLHLSGRARVLADARRDAFLRDPAGAAPLLANVVDHTCQLALDSVTCSTSAAHWNAAVCLTLKLEGGGGAGGWARAMAHAARGGLASLDMALKSSFAPFADRKWNPSLADALSAVSGMMSAREALAHLERIAVDDCFNPGTGLRPTAYVVRLLAQMVTEAVPPNEHVLSATARAFVERG